jgi:CheY-like chemotaxis protein
MSRRAMRYGMMWTCVATLVLGVISPVRAQNAPQGPLAQFSRAIAHYKAGEEAKANALFRKTLALNPDMGLAVQLRERAEIGLFIAMQDNPNMAKTADAFVDLFLKATRENKRALPEVEALLKDFQSTVAKTHLEARSTLRGFGPFVVHKLLPLLTKQGEGNLLTTARTSALLASMERDASLPLAVALLGSEDTGLKVRIASALATLRDVRAVPALATVAADTTAAEAARTAAADAVKVITGHSVTDLGPVAGIYKALTRQYLNDKDGIVAFRYGFTARIWRWNAEAKTLAWRDVPAWLYHQAMATETALTGLRYVPSDAGLQALALAGMAHQEALCDGISAEGAVIAGRDVTGPEKADAAARSTEFSIQIPIATALHGPAVTGKAVESTLARDDDLAAFILLTHLRASLQAVRPSAPGKSTAASLIVALKYPRQDVSSAAAIILCEACPQGIIGSPAHIVSVIGRAARYTAARHALVVMDKLQERTGLANILRTSGLIVSESSANPEAIAALLKTRPAVDVSLVTGNLPLDTFAAVIGVLKSDYHTQAAPICLVVNRDEDHVPIQARPSVSAVGPTGETVAAALTEAGLAIDPKDASPHALDLARAAAQTLAAIDPAATKYPLTTLEPSLISALNVQDDVLQAALLACLKNIGTSVSLMPLSDLIAGKASDALKTDACRAIVSIVRRTSAKVPELLVQKLATALAAESQDLRRAAAMALAGAGLTPAQIHALTEANFGTKVTVF